MGDLRAQTACGAPSMQVGEITSAAHGERCSGCASSRAPSSLAFGMVSFLRGSLMLECGKPAASFPVTRQPYPLPYLCAKSLLNFLDAPDLPGVPLYTIGPNTPAY